MVKKDWIAVPHFTLSYVFTGWRNVAIELSTHAIGGLSLPDLVLAAKIDAVPVEYSPKWLKDNSAPST